MGEKFNPPLFGELAELLTTMEKAVAALNDIEYIRARLQREFSGIKIHADGYRGELSADQKEIVERMAQMARAYVASETKRREDRARIEALTVLASARAYLPDLAARVSIEIGCLVRELEKRQ